MASFFTSLARVSVAAALAWSADAARPPAGTRVKDVRYWSQSSATRIAIEVEGEFGYRSERLSNPDRIFFDLAGVKPLAPRQVHTTEVNDRFVKRIRIAETTPGVTRIVLDLAAPAEYTVSQLSNPDRLIVELRDGPVPNPLSASTEEQIPPRTPPTVFLPPAPSPKPAEPPQPVVNAEPPRLTPSQNIAKVKPPVSPDAVQPPEQSPDARRASRSSDLPKAARHTIDGNTSLTRALGLKLNRVVLDPGHGGNDAGTAGPHGLKEKDLVLDVAKRLGKLIEDRMGSEVIYTRGDDTFVSLRERTEIANQKKADLFLSLHANSSPYSKVGGVETYYLNFTSSQEALDVAARENATSEQSIYELREIIQKITAHDKAEESREFALRVQDALFGFAVRTSPGLRNRGVKKAPFVVLIGATMPSVLAEVGFVTNAREEALLKRPDHRQKLAEALYRGVSKYAETLSHFQVASRTE